MPMTDRIRTISATEVAILTIGIAVCLAAILTLYGPIIPESELEAAAENMTTSAEPAFPPVVMIVSAAGALAVFALSRLWERY